VASGRLRALLLCGFLLPGSVARADTVPIRFQQKRLPESASFLQKAIQPQPRLLGAHLSLAQVYTLQGKSEMVLYIQGGLAEAAERLSESARLQPEQLASHYYLALVARDRGHDAEAIAILGKLVQRYDHGPSCEALSGLRMSAQRYTEAERSLRKAVQLTPKSVKANYQLGLLLARMGRKEEADKQLEFAKLLRKEDEAASRLQLRLLEPGR